MTKGFDALPALYFLWVLFAMVGAASVYLNQTKYLWALIAVMFVASFAVFFRIEVDRNIDDAEKEYF